MKSARSYCNLKFIFAFFNGLILRSSQQVKYIKPAMRILTGTLFLLIFSTSLVVGQSYNSPESLDYHPGSGYWFISNQSAQQILRKSVSGPLTVFASNLGGNPHGLEIIGDTLYVDAGSRILGYDINTGAQTMNLNLGATFLNGLTADNQGLLYATDFSAKKIYRIDPQVPAFEILVANTVSTPNGIVYDPLLDRLVFCNWGANAPVKAVNLQTAEVTTIMSTNLTNCDGIVRNSYGDFYISSWSPQIVTVFKNNFNGNTQQVINNLSNAADLGYDMLHDTLGIPNSGTANNVVFVGIQHNGPEFQGIGEVIYDTVVVNENYERTFTAVDPEADAFIYNVFINAIETPGLGWTPVDPNSAKVEGILASEGDYSYYIEVNGYENKPDTVTVYLHAKLAAVGTSDVSGAENISVRCANGQIYCESKAQFFSNIILFDLNGARLYASGPISAQQVVLTAPDIPVVLVEMRLSDGSKVIRKVVTSK